MPHKRRALLVTYDLNTADDQRRSAIFDILKESDGWWHYVASTWLLVTTHTPQTLIDRVTPHLQTADRLLVIEVKPNYHGWLPNKAWRWINQNLPKYATD
jgi:hypothetical protein